MSLYGPGANGYRTPNLRRKLNLLRLSQKYWGLWYHKLNVENLKIYSLITDIFLYSEKKT